MSRVVEVPLAPIAQGLLVPSGCAGVFARTAIFEQVIEGLSTLISRHREPDTEILRFPPVMSRRQLEISGYLESFPHLLGGVSCLEGKESEVRALVERGDWVTGLSATDLVLAPAACYPVYPLAAARGDLPEQGMTFDVASFCFRREATHEVDRFQAFQMREYVCIGTPAQVLDFRTRWVSRAQELAKQMGLSFRIAVASDPFFGKGGRLAALSQLEQSLKFELLVGVQSEEKPTACMSFNYHRDHFGTAWAMRTDDGNAPHTACVAFGLDRLALALFAAHGLNLRKWPPRMRKNLSL